MIIICPECATQFSVPDDAITEKGRKVKCKECGHIWKQELNSAKSKNILQNIRSGLQKHNVKSLKTAIYDIITTLNYKRLIPLLMLFMVAVFLGLVANKIIILPGMNKNHGLTFHSMKTRKEILENTVGFFIDTTIKNESKMAQTLESINIKVLSSKGRDMGQTKFNIPEDIKKIAAGQTITISPYLTINANASIVSMNIGNDWEKFFY